MPGVADTMREFKSGTLHSRSKKGPLVSDRKQAIAIALSQARKAGGGGARGQAAALRSAR